MIGVLQNLPNWYYAQAFTAKLLAGDICSVKSGNHFAIAKVLEASRDVIHVRLYEEKFQ